MSTPRGYVLSNADSSGYMVSLGDWVELNAAQDPTGPMYVQRSHIAFSPSKSGRIE